MYRHTYRQFAAALVAVAALAGAALSAPGAAHAAGKSVGVIDHDWSFEGPFGTFDQAQLQRGWQVYAEVCAGCHSMKFLSYRDLGDPTGPAFPEEQVKAIAAQFFVPDLDEFGEPTTRPALPADKLASPFPNDEAAKIAMGGAVPPDLSLMAKARTGYTGIITQMVQGIGGSEYIYSLMLGYQDEPPEGFEVTGILAYNKYYPGHLIAMAQPIYPDGILYQDGTEATMEQQAADVTAFLTWAAEPKMVERKMAGVRNLIFLGIFAVLLWYSNRKLWQPLKYGE